MLTQRSDRRLPEGPRHYGNMGMAIMRSSIRLFAILVIGTLLGVTSAHAQKTTTGAVRGRIQDQTGNAIAGAVITARSLETGFQRQARTSADGLYVVRLLLPGVYSLDVRAIGYQPGSVARIRVRVGSATPANFALGQAAVALEAITVTAEQVQVDVAEGGVRQLVTQEEIEQLPSLGRDFVDFINLSGLVATDPGETTGGQFSIAGQRASQTSLLIDGADANNSFFGENRGGSRIPFNFSLESIREFEIVTNGFDVEYSDFTGGIINVVTRGGTNEFEGTLYGNFRSDALTSSPFIIDPGNPEITTDYSVQQYAGRISGPIKQDKAFFLFSIDGQRRREPQLPLTQSRFAPGGEDEDAVVFDEMTRYFQILENQYGISNAAAGYRPFQTSNDAVTLFGRIDWSLNDNHRLSIRTNFSTFTNDNEWDGVFDFQYGISRAERFKDRSYSTVGELTSVLGDNTFNLLRFQFSDETRPRQGKDLRPTLSVNLSNGQRVRYGGSFAAFNNRLDETKIELIDNLTRVMGAHTFKLGGRFLRTSYFNRFMFFGSQFQGAGEYVFSNLDDFETFTPSSYFRPIQEGGGVPTSNFSVIDWALYLQDSWQLTPRLTATFGLRYGQKSFRDSPTPVASVEQAFGWRTGFAPTDKNNFSPRLALAYDVRGDGRSVVRGGLGFFYGPLPGVVGGNVLQTERPVLEVICNGSLADGDPDAPPPPTDYATWDRSGLGSGGVPEAPITCASASAGGVPTFAFWAPDFEMPEVLKANLGYETMLGDGTRFAVNLLYAQTWNLYTVRNLNLRDAQFLLSSEGNRSIFTPMGTFDPTTANRTGSRRNLEFGDVLVNFNDGRARSIVAEFRGSRRFSPGLSINASYTYTKAWDNSPYSCCTAIGGYASPTTGAFGPNEIGGFGDRDRAWGISDFARTHAIVLSAFANLPLGFRFAAFWKSQSGRPWTVVGNDDLNGDGINGNDRTFIFAAADLPLASTGADADAERALYSRILREDSCVGDFVGGIVERNTCRMPWRNDMNIRLTRGFGTFSGQRAEVQVDFFNVLNGIGRLFCNESAPNADLTSGICGLGRVTGVFGSNQELLNPRGFNPATGQILYSVNQNFGDEDLLGANLVLQFQVQLAMRYFF